MPRFSIWTIRAALLYLATGFTLGALLLWNKGITISPQIWRLLSTHIEFLIFGWTLQLVMGVAFWILPRFRRPPKRGNEQVAWLAAGLLNLGIWLVVAGSYLASIPWLPALGRSSEFLAAFTFALYAWPRVKPAGK